MAKVTKRDMFVEVAGVLEGLGETALVEFIDAQVALLDKRAGAERGETKTQVENAEFKAMIVGMLDAEGTTATDIATALDLSVQRVSQLLRQMVLAGEVIRTEGKGKTKTLFSV